MPRYTLMTTGADGRRDVAVTDFGDDVCAIQDARAGVDAERRSIAVARGEGEDLEFLGAWDLIDDEPIWWAD